MKKTFIVIVMILLPLVQYGVAFSSPDPLTSTITQEEADELNAKLDKALELSDTYMFLKDRKHKKANETKLRQAINLYDEVLVRVPKHWVSLFFRGKAYQALREHENAYQSFKSAFHLQTDNKDVLNEYAVESMELGYFEEALSVLEKGQQKFQSDIGVRGNYALALIMNNRIDDGLKALYQVQNTWPNDPVTKNVIVVAKKIKSGEASLPTTIIALHQIK